MAKHAQTAEAEERRWSDPAKNRRLLMVAEASGSSSWRQPLASQGRFAHVGPVLLG